MTPNGQDPLGSADERDRLARVRREYSRALFVACVEASVEARKAVVGNSEDARHGLM
jgi:hypothetical protein